MNIGVKFCGGCNPNYDRGRLYLEIKNKYSGDSFETAREGIIYDILLVIAGCERACVDYSGYRGVKTVLVVNNEIPKLY